MNAQNFRRSGVNQVCFSYKDKTYAVTHSDEISPAHFNSVRRAVWEADTLKEARWLVSFYGCKVSRVIPFQPPFPKLQGGAS